MKHLKGLFATLFCLLLFVNNLYSQCSTSPAISATYCVGQAAKIEVEDPATNVKYGWFTDVTDDIPNYGTDGKGRSFVSPGTQSSPSTFYYQKETNLTIGPAYRSPFGGQSVLNDGVYPYRMPVNSSVDFRLNTITVLVKMANPASTYGFGVRYSDGTDTTYSTWFTGKPTDFLDIGSGYYRVEVPVDMLISQGTSSIEFISDDDPGGAFSGVDEIYWWNSTAYNGAFYADNNIEVLDPDIDVNGTNLSPLLMDWDVTVLCSRKPVTTTLSSVCCTPVGNSFSVSAPTSNPTSSDFPLTLTATGPDITSSMYYYWYDADNTLLASGQGLSTYDVNEAGQYTVRVVNAPSDQNEAACYSNHSIILGIKSIFAPDDFSICLGDPVTLRGEGAEGKYNWYSNDAVTDTYIVQHNVQTTDAYILKPGTFTFTVEGEVKLGNIAYDGKFEFFDDADNFNPAQPGRTFETANGIAQGTVGGLPGYYITGPGEYRVDDKIIAYSSNSEHCKTSEYPNYWDKTDPVTGDVVSRGKIFYADAVSGKTETPYTDNFGATYPLWQLSNQPILPNTTY